MIWKSEQCCALMSNGKGVTRNLLKISPPSKISPPPFLNEVVAKGAFLSRKYNVLPPIYAAVHAVMLSKKQHKGRHVPLLSLPKQAHDKRSIAESLHAQITRARLTACEVGVFSREISQCLKIHPPPSFRSHLSLSPMGVFSREISQLSKIHPPPLF